MCQSPLPEARLVERLAQQLRVAPTVAAWIDGLAALSRAVMARGGLQPPWAGPLTQALVASRAEVVSQALNADARARTFVAAGVLVLGTLRPSGWAQDDRLSRALLGPDGANSPVRLDAEALMARFLVARHHWDQESASSAAVALRATDAGRSYVMDDWAVAFVHCHGVSREAQCHAHMRAALLDEGGPMACLLVWLGAVVVMGLARVPREETLSWCHAQPETPSILDRRVAPVHQRG